MKSTLTSDYFFEKQPPKTHPLKVEEHALRVDRTLLTPESGPEDVRKALAQWGFEEIERDSSTLGPVGLWIHPCGAVVTHEALSGDWQGRVTILATLDMGRYHEEEQKLQNASGALSKDTSVCMTYTALDGSDYQQVVMSCQPHQVAHRLEGLQSLGRLCSLSSMALLEKAGNWPHPATAREEKSVAGYDISSPEAIPIPALAMDALEWVGSTVSGDRAYKKRHLNAMGLHTLVKNLAKQQRIRYGRQKDYCMVQRWVRETCGVGPVTLDHTVLKSGLSQAVCLATVPKKKENGEALLEWVKTAPMENLLRVVAGKPDNIPPLVPLLLYSWINASEIGDPGAFSSLSERLRPIVAAVVKRVGPDAVRETWGDVWEQMLFEKRKGDFTQECSKAVEWVATQTQWPLPDSPMWDRLKKRFGEDHLGPLRAWAKEKHLKEAWAPTKSSSKPRM